MTQAMTNNIIQIVIILVCSCTVLWCAILILRLLKFMLFLPFRVIRFLARPKKQKSPGQVTPECLYAIDFLSEVGDTIASSPVALRPTGYLKAEIIKSIADTHAHGGVISHALLRDKNGVCLGELSVGMTSANDICMDSVALCEGDAIEVRNVTISFGGGKAIYNPPNDIKGAQDMGQRLPIPEPNWYTKDEEEIDGTLKFEFKPVEEERSYEPSITTKPPDPEIDNLSNAELRAYIQERIKRLTGHE